MHRFAQEAALRPLAQRLLRQAAKSPCVGWQQFSSTSSCSEASPWVRRRGCVVKYPSWPSARRCGGASTASAATPFQTTLTVAQLGLPACGGIRYEFFFCCTGYVTTLRSVRVDLFVIVCIIYRHTGGTTGGPPWVVPQLVRQTDSFKLGHEPTPPPTLFQAGSASASPTSQRLTGITSAHHGYGNVLRLTR